jgi:hypothetical protein
LKKSKYLYKDLNDFESHSFSKVNNDFRHGWGMARFTQEQAGARLVPAWKVPLVYWSIIITTIGCGAVSALYFIWKD